MKKINFFEKYSRKEYDKILEITGKDKLAQLEIELPGVVVNTEAISKITLMIEICQLKESGKSYEYIHKKKGIIKSTALRWYAQYQKWNKLI